jgi:restriction system protein
MAIPDFQAFMLPFLRALEDGNVHTLQALYLSLSDELNLSEEDKLELLPSGKQKVFHGRIGWARTYLKKAGLLDTVKRGVFKISVPGKQLLETNPSHINKQVLEQYPSYLEFMNLSKTKTNNNQSSKEEFIEIAQTPTEQIEQAHKAIQNELADELLSIIKEGSPQFFEHLVVDLMLAMGYGGARKDAGKATQYSNDGGIDGIINEDPLGLDTIYLQAKRYTTGTIGRPDIQSFAGALDMQKAKKGVFITTSRFSKDAIEFVNMIEKSIVLIDGQKLAELMIKYDLGVATKQVYAIKQIDSDYFSED